MDWWRSDVNEEQLRAITAPDTPILVMAGPGSGKTRVLIHRMGLLVCERHTDPRHIVALTFTNKAAGELHKRLQGSLDSDNAKKLMAGTFHSVCARWLRKHGSRIGIPAHFSIWDTDDQKRAVAHIVRDLDLDRKQYPAADILQCISLAKANRISPAAMARTDQEWTTKVAQVYMMYQELLHRSEALDFDEILSATMRLWEHRAEVLASFRSQYQHVLVDEFQDTNALQCDLLLKLTGPDNAIFAVGDSDQSIYGWRGASSDNILKLHKRYPHLAVFDLTSNYRSTQLILDLAQQVIDGSQDRYRPRVLRSAAMIPGMRPVLVACTTPTHEAFWAARSIAQHIRDGADPTRIAVLYRTNAQSRAIEAAMIEHEVPYTIIGGTRFYDRREIKDLLAYVRLISNPQDTPCLLRVINVPPRGIGAQTVAHLVDLAKANNQTIADAIRAIADTIWGPPSILRDRSLKAVLQWVDLQQDLAAIAAGCSVGDLLRTICKRIGYKAYLMKSARADSDVIVPDANALTEDLDVGDGVDRWNNVEECIAYADTFASYPVEQQMPKFLEAVALLASEARQDHNGAVRCMSLHRAKGMEFQIVYLCGVVEGVLPLVRSSSTLEEREEERRLLYVGITRAELQLYVLWYLTSIDYKRKTHEHEPSSLLPAEWLATSAALPSG